MKPARILVIEDTPANLELVKILLESAGHPVLSACTAEPGLLLAASERPDLILMDISLPGMNGLEATRRLKANPATAHIPVAALTAHAMQGDEESALAAGCAAYLTKPINTRTFVQQVTELLPARTPTEPRYEPDHHTL